MAVKALELAGEQEWAGVARYCRIGLVLATVVSPSASFVLDMVGKPATMIENAADRLATDAICWRSLQSCALLLCAWPMTSGTSLRAQLPGEGSLCAACHLLATSAGVEPIAGWIPRIKSNGINVRRTTLR